MRPSVRHESATEKKDRIRREGFDLERDFEFIRKALPLPNPEPVPVEGALHFIGYGVGDLVVRGYCSVDGTRRLARYFLRKTQAGRLDGSGLVVLAQWGVKFPPLAFEFTICDHDAVEGDGANPLRGWRPARCRKCGLDMTVDSGD